MLLLLLDEVSGFRPRQVRRCQPPTCAGEVSGLSLSFVSGLAQRHKQLCRGQLRRGLSLDDAIAEAVARGYANPTR